jgi:hypothetical protein
MSAMPGLVQKKNGPSTEFFSIVHCCAPPKSARVARRVLCCDTGTAALSQLSVLLQNALCVTLRSGDPERSVTSANAWPGHAQAVVESAARRRRRRRFVFMASAPEG